MDLGTLPDRVNKLEREMHTMQDRIGDLRPLPERMTKAEVQLEQLSALPAKIDQQNAQIIALKDLVIENQTSIKRYLSWVSGGAGVFMFMLIYGDKILKILSRGSI